MEGAMRLVTRSVAVTLTLMIVASSSGDVSTKSVGNSWDTPTLLTVRHDGGARVNEKPPFKIKKTQERNAPSTPTSIGLSTSRSASHLSSSTVAKSTTNVLVCTPSLSPPHALAIKQPRTQNEENDYEREGGREEEGKCGVPI